MPLWEQIRNRLWCQLVSHFFRNWINYFVRLAYSLQSPGVLFLIWGKQIGEHLDSSTSIANLECISGDRLCFAREIRSVVQYDEKLQNAQRSDRCGNHIRPWMPAPHRPRRPRPRLRSQARHLLPHHRHPRPPDCRHDGLGTPVPVQPRAPLHGLLTLYAWRQYPSRNRRTSLYQQAGADLQARS